MWTIKNKPIPTYGMNGKTFLLYLEYNDFYGYKHTKKSEYVKAAWDSLNETFYEINTKKQIRTEDIVKWDYDKESEKEINNTNIIEQDIDI